MSTLLVSRTQTFTRSVAMVTACLVLPQLSFAHDNGAYSHDGGSKTTNPHWMSFMLDSVRLSHMSLPGTHDTMALGPGGDVAQAQSMSLETQLRAGIRVLDIRCRHFKDGFPIHHGSAYQNADFGYVLEKTAQFLTEYPRETVLMRVSEEYNAEGNTRSFEATFATYYERYRRFFWVPAYGPNGEPNYLNPTLGEMRGKIVVLQDFKGQSMWGIPYDQTAFVIQDNYSLPNGNSDLYRKWTHVKNHLNDAQVAPRERTYINYLSGSGVLGGLLVFPYFVASGHSDPRTNAPRLWTGLTTAFGLNGDTWPDFPRLDCLFSWCSIYYEGTNTLTVNHIRSKNNSGQYPRVGIIMADFPGHELIETVIKQNSVLTQTFTWRPGAPCMVRPMQNVLLARNGWQELVWQIDGNLVLYDSKGPRWATHTNSPTANLLCFQGDGNLVIYDPAKPGGVAFASNTYNGGGNTLDFQYDCNLVIYNSNRAPIWAASWTQMNPMPCGR